MRKPSVIKLPTSQMMVFMDFFGIDYRDLVTPESQIEALEAVPQKLWSEIKVGVNTRAAETVDEDIVARRMANLGRAPTDPEPPAED